MSKLDTYSVFGMEQPTLHPRFSMSALILFFLLPGEVSQDEFLRIMKKTSLY